MKRSSSALSAKGFIGRQRYSLLIAALLTGLFCFRLTGLTGGRAAGSEVQTFKAAGSWHGVITHPFAMPLNGVRWLLLQAGGSEHRLLALRAASVLLGLISIGCLMYVCRRWYGQRTMLFAVIVIGLSAWILHVSRLATDDILYLSAGPLLLAASLHLHQRPERWTALLLVLAVVCWLVYIPGLVWLGLAGLIWQRRELRTSWQRLSTSQKFLIVTVVALLLAPFVYATLQQPSRVTVLTWLGLPGSLPTWQQPFKDLAATVLFIGVRTPTNPTSWLGRLPLLDAFLLISLVAGMIFYGKHIRAERTRLLLLYTFIGLALAAAGNEAARSLLVPVIYLVAVGGIAFILHQWLKLFPRNVLARRVGVTLICAAVALSCAYNIREYFIVWPHNQATRQAYLDQLPRT